MLDAAAIRSRLAEQAQRVRFSPAAHKYWLDDKPCPGVTTITKLLHREQLERWKIRQQAKGTARACIAYPRHADEEIEAYADRMLKQADALLEADRIAGEAASHGSQFHALVEWHCRKEIGQETPRPLASDQAEALYDQWTLWAIAEDFEVVAVEQRVFCDSGETAPIRYAGTLDLLAFTQGQLTILDWKSRSGAGQLWPDQRLQSVAYRKAVAHMLGDGIAKWPAGKIVVVPRDGGFAKPIPVESDPLEDWRAFEALLYLYRWSK